MVLSKLRSLFGGGSGSKRLNVKERFDIKGKSGMGSMSKVFRAFDRQLKKTVCLKLLDIEKTKQFEARFVGLKKPSEGEISVALKHPFLVETYEHGITTTGEPYLIQDWVAAHGLQGLIESSNTNLDGARTQILAQVADALEYMHQQKYIHRDICPRNVLVTEDGEVKLIDFGLTVPYKPEFCKPGNRTGTPQYLAPEILKRQSTDHRVDLFSLGVTAYQTFTGTFPWGKYENPNVQMASYANPGADPRGYVSDLDDAVAEFLIKAIEREPAKRFPSATAFRDAVLKLPRT
jgi:eukaryotic-like serine/threonine-protein kinase